MRIAVGLIGLIALLHAGWGKAYRWGLYEVEDHVRFGGSQQFELARYGELHNFIDTLSR
jgi:hypothetical protein